MLGWVRLLPLLAGQLSERVLEQGLHRLLGRSGRRCGRGRRGRDFSVFLGLGLLRHLLPQVVLLLKRLLLLVGLLDGVVIGWQLRWRWSGLRLGRVDHVDRRVVVRLVNQDRQIVVRQRDVLDSRGLAARSVSASGSRLFRGRREVDDWRLLSRVDDRASVFDWRGLGRGCPISGLVSKS
jgi:hypothetical protein